MVKKPPITQLFLTKNECYIIGRKHTVKGIMRHSTGANNPYLSRYIGPDDGVLGRNQYNNHWNQFRPSGRQVCVHAFIGKDKNGVVRIYQTLPWDYVGWHSGRGSKGSANNMGYIGYEICEDALNDKAYFDECMALADQLDAYLLDLYGLKVSPTTLIDHAEGWRMGIASNHGDIGHWLRRYGMTMNDVRARVKKLMEIKEGWVKNNTGWWYQNKDGTYPKSAWKKVKGKWYYFDNKGYMVTGWRKVKGKWYYMNSSGAMETGLINVKGKFYYLNKDGSMVADGEITLKANKSGELS